MVEVLLVAGRAGVGKTTVAAEVSRLLRDADVAHVLIEGDCLDAVHPAPSGDPHRTVLTERNLAALWANYRELGHHRLLYTNTVAALEGALVARAVGATHLHTVVLTASDATVDARLAVRETGSGLATLQERSARAARRLAEEAPPGTVCVPTDGRDVVGLARAVLAATKWAPEHGS